MGAMPIPWLRCGHCKRFQGYGTPKDAGFGVEPFEVLVCEAFPDGDGIPEDIRENRFDHIHPHPGDHGLQFLPRSAE
jgi:hypothetical protein